MMPHRILLVLLAALAFLNPASAERIRLGTLAPKGTSFHQILQEMGREWSAPPSKLQVTIFPDGTMGSERDMLRRMRLGQLQAALITVTGLASIESGTAALQNLPFTFRTLDEAVHVRRQLAPELERRLLEKGFVVLGWTDGGWVQFFTRSPATTPEELKNLKMFTWAGDTETSKLAQELGFRTVPLEVSDILVSLNTGMIDTVPTPPFFALAGQFFGPAPHMLEVDYAPIVGAIVLTKRSWEALDLATRESLRASASRAADRITERSRIEMVESVEAMRRRGLSVFRPDVEQRKAWDALGEQIRPRLRGELIDAVIFDQAMAALESYRAQASVGVTQ